MIGAGIIPPQHLEELNMKSDIFEVACEYARIVFERA